jgi:hypothetical protein
MILHSARPVEVSPAELEEIAFNAGVVIDMGGDRDRLRLRDGRCYFAVRVPTQPGVGVA